MESELHSALVRFVLENHHEPVVVLDENCQIVDWNEGAVRGELDLVDLLESSDTDTGDARIRSFVEELHASRKSHTLIASAAGRVFRLEGTRVERFAFVVARELSE